ncbi:MAG TPA: TetR/AcrR family transcriptional regulator, partial [Niastella sp.]
NRGELQPLPFEVYWAIAFAPLYQLIKFHAQGNSPANACFRISDEIVDQTLKLVLKALKP